MVMGRPHTDLKQLAKELIKWSTEPTAMNLMQFSSPRGMSVTKLPEWAEKDENFREALQLAKENIGINRFESAVNNELPKDLFLKAEGNYDPLHRAYFREEKEFESKLRKSEKTSAEEYNSYLAENLSNLIKSKSEIRK